jgi:poly(3-hydroxybutyrate) depolymerase
MKRIFFVLVPLMVSFTAWAGPWQAKDLRGLKYQIYLPQNIATARSTNLMVTLHGCAQKADDLARFGNWDKAADKYNTVVVAPDVPNGGVIFGCWDYYGPNHNEQNHHHAPILALVAELLRDPALKINPRRVYISGLSSGAGEALLLACMRPDVFAGVGLNSSPAVPSGSGDISNPPIDGVAMEKFCRDISTTHEAAFKTQLMSVIVGDNDTLVNPLHSKVIVDAGQLLYKTEGTQVLDLTTLEGSNKQGEGTLYLRKHGKPQISFILNKGIGHNWAAGSGMRAPGAYITQNSINYPMYLLQFFESGNRR